MSRHHFEPLCHVPNHLLKPDLSMERAGHKRRASSTFVAVAPRFTRTLTVNPKIELISPSIQFDVIDDWSATVGCDSATLDLV